jgi:hypothetical protein
MTECPEELGLRLVQRARWAQDGPCTFHQLQILSTLQAPAMSRSARPPVAAAVRQDAPDRQETDAYTICCILDASVRLFEL